MKKNTRVRKCEQQRNIAAQIEGISSVDVFNLLTDPLLFDELEALLPDYRESVYNPTEVLSLMLWQKLTADQSCQRVVDAFCTQRVAAGLSPISVSTGGYCRARQRLPVELLQGLALLIGCVLETQVLPTWLWQGRHVKVVDGTCLSMPDSEANQAQYPQHGMQEEGSGFPQCRLVGVTSLATGAVQALAMGSYQGKGTGETSLLRTIQDCFEAGDIVLADAMYPTWFFIRDMQQKCVDIVMEQQGSRQRSTDFRCGKKLGERDHIVEWLKPKVRPSWMSADDYAEAPDAIKMRECQVGNKTLVTTLLDEKIYSKKMLEELYRSRWNIELDIRNIKTTMKMDKLSCKTPDMIEKEIWTYMLSYNLMRLLMAQSAKLASCLPRELSFKHCMQVWEGAKNTLDMLNEEHYRMLLRMMAGIKVGKRKGRIEPRQVKQRPKAYPRLKGSRHEARAEIRLYGHA